MLVAMVVLPTPPLGEKTPITRPLLVSALAGLLGIRWRLAKDWQARSSRTRIWAGSADGLRMSRMPARMACRMKSGSGSLTRRTLRSGNLDVEDRGEAQGIVDGDVRSEDEDLGLFLVQVGEQSWGRRGGCW